MSHTWCSPSKRGHSWRRPSWHDVRRPDVDIMKLYTLRVCAKCGALGEVNNQGVIVLLAAVIAIVLGGCASAHWTKRDTAVEVSIAAVAAADYEQTRWITYNCWEDNPVMGACGDRLPPILYFPVLVAAHAAIAALLPSGAWRRGWQMAFAGAEGDTVYQNQLSGYTVTGDHPERYVHVKIYREP